MSTIKHSKNMSAKERKASRKECARERELREAAIEETLNNRSRRSHRIETRIGIEIGIRSSGCG